MNTSIERRLNKLEEVRDRNDVGNEVDTLLEKMGTSRAEMLADFGSLIAFRNWLAAQTGVQQTASSHHRQWQGDSAAISAKWNAILDQYEAPQ